MIYKAYSARKILSPNTTSAQKMDALAELPLLFHPGEGWEYSVAIDVLSHLIEVISGQPYDAFDRRPCRTRPACAAVQQG